MPHYVATPPNPRATHALLERLATLLDRLDEHHVPRVGVGKVDDLFAGLR